MTKHHYTKQTKKQVNKLQTKKEKQENGFEPVCMLFAFLFFAEACYQRADDDEE
jgi:hypothetical protein